MNHTIRICARGFYQIGCNIPRQANIVTPRVLCSFRNMRITAPSRGISFKSFLGRDKSDSSNDQESTAASQQQNENMVDIESGTTVDQQKDNEQNQELSSQEIMTLKSQLEETQQEAKNLKEKYLRALAEMENVRERAKHQVQDAKNFGIQKFAKDMLEIADVLQMALDNVPESARDPENNHALNDLFEGLVTTNKLLHHIFERHNLHVLNPVGEKFDPNHHDALFEVPYAEDKTSGTVGVVTKIGYTLNGRTIRPACVGVVAKP
eukprot:gene746-4035_t